MAICTGDMRIVSKVVLWRFIEQQNPHVHYIPNIRTGRRPGGRYPQPTKTTDSNSSCRGCRWGLWIEDGSDLKTYHFVVFVCSIECRILLEELAIIEKKVSGCANFGGDFQPARLCVCPTLMSVARDRLSRHVTFYTGRYTHSYTACGN